MFRFIFLVILTLFKDRYAIGVRIKSPAPNDGSKLLDKQHHESNLGTKIKASIDATRGIEIIHTTGSGEHKFLDEYPRPLSEGELVVGTDLLLGFIQRKDAIEENNELENLVVLRDDGSNRLNAGIFLGFPCIYEQNKEFLNNPDINFIDVKTILSCIKLYSNHGIFEDDIRYLFFKLKEFSLYNSPSKVFIGDKQFDKNIYLPIRYQGLLYLSILIKHGNRYSNTNLLNHIPFYLEKGRLFVEIRHIYSNRHINFEFNVNFGFGGSNTQHSRVEENKDIGIISATVNGKTYMEGVKSPCNGIIVWMNENINKSLKNKQYEYNFHLSKGSYLEGDLILLILCDSNPSYITEDRTKYRRENNDVLISSSFGELRDWVKSESSVNNLNLIFIRQLKDQKERSELISDIKGSINFDDFRTSLINYMKSRVSDADESYLKQVIDMDKRYITNVYVINREKQTVSNRLADLTLRHKRKLSAKQKMSEYERAVLNGSSTGPTYKYNLYSKETEIYNAENKIVPKWKGYYHAGWNDPMNDEKRLKLSPLNYTGKYLQIFGPRPWNIKFLSIDIVRAFSFSKNSEVRYTLTNEFLYLFGKYGERDDYNSNLLRIMNFDVEMYVDAGNIVSGKQGYETVLGVININFKGPLIGRESQKVYIYSLHSGFVKHVLPISTVAGSFDSLVTIIPFGVEKQIIEHYKQINYYLYDRSGSRINLAKGDSLLLPLSQVEVRDEEGQTVTLTDSQASRIEKHVYMWPLWEKYFPELEEPIKVFEISPNELLVLNGIVQKLIDYVRSISIKKIVYSASSILLKKPEFDVEKLRKEVYSKILSEHSKKGGFFTQRKEQQVYTKVFGDKYRYLMNVNRSKSGDLPEILNKFIVKGHKRGKKPKRLQRKGPYGVGTKKIPSVLKKIRIVAGKKKEKGKYSGDEKPGYSEGFSSDESVALSDISVKGREEKMKFVKGLGPIIPKRKNIYKAEGYESEVSYVSTDRSLKLSDTEVDEIGYEMGNANLSDIIKKSKSEKDKIKKLSKKCRELFKKIDSSLNKRLEDLANVNDKKELERIIGVLLKEVHGYNECIKKFLAAVSSKKSHDIQISLIKSNLGEKIRRIKVARKKIVLEYNKCRNSQKKLSRKFHVAVNDYKVKSDKSKSMSEEEVDELKKLIESAYNEELKCQSYSIKLRRMENKKYETEIERYSLTNRYMSYRRRNSMLLSKYLSYLALKIKFLVVVRSINMTIYSTKVDIKNVDVVLTNEKINESRLISSISSISNLNTELLKLFVEENYNSFDSMALIGHQTLLLQDGLINLYSSKIKEFEFVIENQRISYSILLGLLNIINSSDLSNELFKKALTKKVKGLFEKKRASFVDFVNFNTKIKQLVIGKSISENVLEVIQQTLQHNKLTETGSHDDLMNQVLDSNKNKRILKSLKEKINSKIASMESMIKKCDLIGKTVTANINDFISNVAKPIGKFSSVGSSDVEAGLISSDSITESDPSTSGGSLFGSGSSEDLETHELSKVISLYRGLAKISEEINKSDIKEPSDAGLRIGQLFNEISKKANEFKYKKYKPTGELDKEKFDGIKSELISLLSELEKEKKTFVSKYESLLTSYEKSIYLLWPMTRMKKQLINSERRLKMEKNRMKVISSKKRRKSKLRDAGGKSVKDSNSEESTGDDTGAGDEEVKKPKRTKSRGSKPLSKRRKKRKTSKTSSKGDKPSSDQSDEDKLLSKYGQADGDDVAGLDTDASSVDLDKEHEKALKEEGDKGKTPRKPLPSSGDQEVGGNMENELLSKYGQADGDDVAGLDTDASSVDLNKEHERALKEEGDKGKTPRKPLPSSGDQEVGGNMENELLSKYGQAGGDDVAGLDTDASSVDLGKEHEKALKEEEKIGGKKEQKKSPSKAKKKLKTKRTLDNIRGLLDRRSVGSEGTGDDSESDTKVDTSRKPKRVKRETREKRVKRKRKKERALIKLLKKGVRYLDTTSSSSHAEGSDAEGGAAGGSDAEGGAAGGSDAEGGAAGGSDAEGGAAGGSDAEGGASGGSDAEGGAAGGSDAEGGAAGGGGSDKEQEPPEKKKED
ncbi:hypothetical protein FG386_003119, partial [Cryptosporidium ryanae]|uniref:uncharacterized protein n=1 Tax=Cryptosporidium ryanae TaxID=515981 RepID=UPI003519EA6B